MAHMRCGALPHNLGALSLLAMMTQQRGNTLLRDTGIPPLSAMMAKRCCHVLTHNIWLTPPPATMA